MFDCVKSAILEAIEDIKADASGLREGPARLDRMQDKPLAVTDDLTVNFTAAMKSDRLARNAMEDVRALSDEMTALRAQVRRLSAKVFGPGDLH